MEVFGTRGAGSPLKALLHRPPWLLIRKTEDRAGDPRSLDGVAREEERKPSWAEDLEGLPPRQKDQNHWKAHL